MNRTTPSLTTPTAQESLKITLQICFGVFGIIGTLVAVASLHYRESLGCVLFKRPVKPCKSACAELRRGEAVGWC